MATQRIWGFIPKIFYIPCTQVVAIWWVSSRWVCLLLFLLQEQALIHHLDSMSLLIASSMHIVLPKVLIEHWEHFLLYCLLWTDGGILHQLLIHVNRLWWEASLKIWVLWKWMWHRLLSRYLLLLSWLILLLWLCHLKYLINWHLSNISCRYLFLRTLFEWCHHLNLIELIIRSHGTV